MASPATTRVILVDPDAASRQSTASLLAARREIELAGAFPSAAAARRELETSTSAVLVTDLPGTGDDTLHLLNQVRTDRPHIRAVVRATTDNLDLILHALEAGASGCVFKTDPPAHLVDAVIDLDHGGRPLSPRVSRLIVTYFNRKGIRRQDGARLSHREMDVLRHVVKGLRSKEIGVQLGISMDTVNTHVRHIYDKLGVASRAQATAWYLEHADFHAGSGNGG